MASEFRARRPASPPRGIPLQTFQPPARPYLPNDHLDADEKRAAASSGLGRTRKAHPPGGIRMSSGEWKLLAGIVILACFVRFFRLSKPNSVVFDEVHFGKFAGKYLRTRYYVDVHPPLAKLLITLAAALGRWDANFDFKEIGKVFENTPYVLMRAFPATFGVGLVPIAYLTLRALDCRPTTALIGSLFITFENGLITQSRLILLDSPLVFFTGLSTFFWVGFCNEDKAKPFTEQWWGWLTLTGLSLGAVFSCKWVGLFTIATIGFSTVRQLWLLLGDLRVTPRLFVRHFLARALCLIVVPALFYMAMFELHFLILQNSGDGDGFMSSEFQHTLGGRSMQDTFADVALGSEITIRHVNTQGGYLHSHAHNYPGGSNQQQITLYPHRDSNNNWLVVNATELGSGADPAKELSYLKQGTVIRLEHPSTKKRLHSHDVRPPISEVDFQNEVSGYGFTDSNDNWVVEIEKGDKRDKHSKERIRTLRTHFRLRHQLTGCYLFSHKVKLPDWGFEQQEVTCNKQAVKANSLWYVETNVHPLLTDKDDKVNYRLPGFLRKFLELQAVMWRTNQGLTERHTYDSRPSSWPILRRGINFWVKDHRQIYLLGNPMVWWLGSLSVVSYFIVRALLIVRAKRGYKDFNHSGVVKYDQLIGFLVMGWSLHYFPFYLMQRQLFLHHYFPALYFSILSFCGVFDLATSSLKPRIRLQIVVVLVILAIWNYSYFSPLAYGNPWTRSRCTKAKWLKTWDFSCHDFYDDYSKYATTTTAPIQQVAVTTIGDAAGGRPPVVVTDVVDKAVKEQRVEEHNAQHTTVAIEQKVEPGPDLFEKPAEEKEASTTKGMPAAAEHKPATNRVYTHKEGDAFGPPSPSEEAVLEALAQAPPVDKKDSEPKTPKFEGKLETAQAEGEQGDSKPAEKKKPDAKLDDSEAEAERVRGQMYPDT